MIETILSHLEGVRRQGRGYVARCPSHQDRSPSLSLREGDDGRTLIHCHAGCTAEAVMSAIGMTLGDLFPDDGKPHRPLPAPGVTRSALRKAAEIERGILFIINADRRANKPVNATDEARAKLASQRIATAGRFGC